MTDIVERIAKAIVAYQPSYSRLDMDGAYPMAQQAHAVMADEIERLREALQKTYCDCELKKEISWHEEENIRLREALRAFNIMLSNPDYDFAELLEEYSAIVRTALEGKE